MSIQLTFYIYLNLVIQAIDINQLLMFRFMAVINLVSLPTVLFMSYMRSIFNWRIFTIY